MGGNAMKHVGVTRKTADEYKDICHDVFWKLQDALPELRCTVVKSYASKETFGDADILVDSATLPDNWTDRLRGIFQPQDMMINGNVVSFDYRGMQIDMIKTQTFEMSDHYYAYNDLGNLMGRIANKMGFSYGHDGLKKVVRDKSHKIATIVVSQDPKQIFPFLGYDYARFQEGFGTLEDIFVYAASTPFFHRAIFQFENHNNENRTRDAKRPSYNAFLKWLEDKPELDKYQWQTHIATNEATEDDSDRKHFHGHAVDWFPGFSEAVHQARMEHYCTLLVKEKWNGKLVSAITGLQGKELGLFMEAFKKDFVEFVNSGEAKHGTFEEMVLACSEEVLETYIGGFVFVYKHRQQYLQQQGK